MGGLGGIVGGLGARGLVAPAGTLRGAVPSCLYLSHLAMAGQEQAPPVGHRAEAHAFLCILGRELELNRKGENVARAGGPQQDRCYGGGEVPKIPAPGSWGFPSKLPGAQG